MGEFDKATTITVQDGTTPYTFKPIRPLPKGLKLRNEKVILGKPTKAGNYRVRIQIKDAKASSPECRGQYGSLH